MAAVFNDDGRAMSAREAIYYGYHMMQKSEGMLGIIAWLQQHYVTVVIGDVINYPRTVKSRKNPEKYLKKSRDYFEHNKDRVEKIKEWLADDQSSVLSN